MTRRIVSARIHPQDSVRHVGVNGRARWSEVPRARWSEAPRARWSVSPTGTLERQPVPRERPDEEERGARAGRLQPQLDTLLQEEQTEAHEDRRPREAAPVELFARDFQAARSGAFARRVDDAVRDLAIAFAIQLHVFAAARRRDHRQRIPIERRPDLRLRRRRRDRSASRNRRRLRRFRNPAAVGGADADDVHGNLTFAGQAQRPRDLTAPRLAVGDQHEGFRVRRFSVQLLIAFDQTKPPRDAELDVRVPRRVVLEAERRLAVQVIEEEEERVGIFREPDFRRRDVREERHRDAIVSPRERFAEDPEEADRPLPAVAGHVGCAHRGGAVLENHEIDAGRPHERDRRGRPREREYRQRRREDRAEPEDEAAENRKPFAHRQPAMLPEPARVAPSPRELPRPHEQQSGRSDQQPEIARIDEADGI